jgi:hypothetical protein
VSGSYRWHALASAGLGLLALGWACWPGGAPQPGHWRVLRATSGAQAAFLSAPSTPPSGTRPAIAPPTADHRLDRPPSISAAQIDAILAAYHSPAAGLGPMLYDLGVQYAIDPAYLVAFFVLESAGGTRGIARTTHSVGNIRCTPGYACVAGYRAYASWAAGARDWFVLLRTLYLDTWNLRTPAAILPRYAPPGDGNDPAAYAASVTQLAGPAEGAPPMPHCPGVAAPRPFRIHIKIVR